MKKTLFIFLILSMLLSSTAYASKARFIDTDEESLFHRNHLKIHVGEDECHVTGNYIKMREIDDKTTVIGHVEQLDSFVLHAVDDKYALIEIIFSHDTSPDSHAGMMGWINADYVDCFCNGAEYKSGKRFTVSDTWGGYQEILDFYYQSILNQPTDIEIVEMGYFEPYFFPVSLEDYGFVIVDINGDTVYELLIFHKDYLHQTNGEVFLSYVYTIKDGHPRRILESANRSQFYLRYDGLFYNEGSNGAAYGVYYVYEMDNGVIKVREGVLSGDYEKNGNIEYGWFFVTERADMEYFKFPLISSEEAASRIQQYRQDVVFDLEGFISFGEYGRICEK